MLVKQSRFWGGATAEIGGIILMPKIDNVVSTTSPGWDDKCWELAKAKEQFKLADIETFHFEFCQQLCISCKYKYEYQCTRDESFALFRPRDP